MKKVLTIGYVHLVVREEIDLPRLMQDLEGSIFVDGAYGHGGIEYRARTGEIVRTKGEYLNDGAIAFVTPPVIDKTSAPEDDIETTSREDI